MSRNIRNNQEGIVSIMVTMILMIVITLIVVGFAQVTRRTQRETLDRQLSTQAYYAAESGVNEAISYFKANSGAPAIDTTNNCSSFLSILKTFKGDPNVNVLNTSSGNNVSYTCLMVNSKPPMLQKAPLDQSSNTVWHLLNNDGLPFTYLQFTWNKNGGYAGANSCTNTTVRPSVANWNCSFGILRVDLAEASTLNNAKLESNAGVNTIFMIPNFSGVGITTLSANKAIVAQAQCGGSTCTVRVNGLTSAEYYARLTIIYQRSDSVSVTGGDAVGGVLFKDGQAIIDATGKAQDQTRRIQVRIPLIQQVNLLPNTGIQTTDSTCKQLTVFTSLYKDNCPL